MLMIVDHVGANPRPWTKMDIAKALFAPNDYKGTGSYRVLVAQGDSQRWMYITSVEREDGSGSSFNVGMTSPDGTKYTIYIRTID